MHGVADLFRDILKNYLTEYKRNSLASNPYFRSLRERIKNTFQPLLKEYGFTIKPLGGQAIMRKIPYIAILAPRHRVIHGIYAIYFFDVQKKISSYLEWVILTKDHHLKN